MLRSFSCNFFLIGIAMLFLFTPFVWNYLQSLYGQKGPQFIHGIFASEPWKLEWGGGRTLKCSSMTKNIFKNKTTGFNFCWGGCEVDLMALDLWQAFQKQVSSKSWSNVLYNTNNLKPQLKSSNGDLQSICKSELKKWNNSGKQAAICPRRAGKARKGN